MKKRSFLILFSVLTLCLCALCGCGPNSGGNTAPTEATTVAEAPIRHAVWGAFEYDEYQDHVILTAYTGNEKTIWMPGVVAKKPVVGFGTTFAHNFSITSVYLPDSIRTIDEQAFYMCDHLTNISMLDGVESIGKEAFAGCSSLTVARIPASVTQIADDAFLYCMNLVIIGEEGSAIQRYADRFQSINFRPSLEEATAAGQSGGSDAAESATSAAPTSAAPTTAAPTTAVKATTTAPATQASTTLPQTEPAAEPAPETEPEPVTEPETETEPETTTLPDDHDEL